MISLNVLRKKLQLPLSSMARRGYIFKNSLNFSALNAIDEVVEVLRNENATDVCVVRTPAALVYADYLVSASGSSTRHLRAVAEGLKRKVWNHESRDAVV